MQDLFSQREQSAVCQASPEPLEWAVTVPLEPWLRPRKHHRAARGGDQIHDDRHQEILAIALCARNALTFDAPRMAFDLPAHLGTFDQRVARLRAVVAAAGNVHLAMIPQQRFASTAELDA